MKIFFYSIVFSVLFGTVHAAAVGVKDVYSTMYAFAALKNDGSVATWGDARYGGDSGDVNFDGGAKEIFSNSYAFVALKK